MPDTSETFLGEIMYVSFNFAPDGFALCNGGLLPINQNQALFSLLGTTYGGNGQTNFALPDLRGRMPMHFESNVHPLGEVGGQESVTLTANQLPVHQHPMPAITDPADLAVPAVGSAPAAVDGTTFGPAYGSPTAPELMAAESVSSTGGSQAHTNIQPYLVLTAVIALQGVFPSND